MASIGSSGIGTPKYPLEEGEPRIITPDRHTSARGHDGGPCIAPPSTKPNGVSLCSGVSRADASPAAWLRSVRASAGRGSNKV